MPWLPILAAALTTVLGCGDDGDGDDGCSADVATVCSAACLCDDMGGSDSDEFCEIDFGSGLTIGFEGQAGCEALVGLNCAAAAAELANCADSIGDGMCDETNPA